MRLFWREREKVEEQPSAETLSVLCRNDIFRYALSRTGDTTMAEDIAVETFADALRALERFDHRLPLKVWLFRIARCKIADEIRRRKRRKETPLEVAKALPLLDGSPEATVLRKEAQQQVRALILSLPELQREALLLQVVENLSIPEIALVLGKSPSAVNSLLGRARESLRRRGAAYFERGGDLS
jgi:RNA polymerase sigma factor (sigma-70 family)